MATKVFLKCVAVGHIAGWTLGKEYPVSDRGTFSSDRGVDGFLACGLTFGGNKFERIERDCFEHGGKTWFSYRGDESALPSAGSKIFLLFADLVQFTHEAGTARGFRLGEAPIGWRYPDSEQKEQYHVFGSPVAGGALFPAFPLPQENDEMICADMPISAIEDSSLTPSQRRHWDEMEAKQAAKEQLKHDAEAKALKERADQLADAGRAMDRVNQDHSHKLGWRP